MVNGQTLMKIVITKCWVTKVRQVSLRAGTYSISEMYIYIDIRSFKERYFVMKLSSCCHRNKALLHNN